MSEMRTLRKRYGHAAGVNMSAQAFAEALQSALRLQGRQVHVRVEPSWGSRKDDEVYVNFINLPAGVGSAGGGAEAENNRASYWIRGFGVAGAPAPAGKVQVEESNSVFSFARNGRAAYKLRKKTAAPNVVAEYLAAHINKIVAEVAPNFTHTGR